MLHARSDKVRSEGGHIVGNAFGKSGGKIARSAGWGAANQRIRIDGEDLMVVVVPGVVEKNLRVGNAVFGGDGGVVDLRNADVKNAVAAANDERMIFTNGVGQSAARAEIVRIERNLAGGREQRIRFSPGGGEGLQIPAYAEIDREMIGDANRVLRESSVVVAVGIGRGRAEILQIILRNGVGIGAERSERKSGFLRRKGERIDFNFDRRDIRRFAGWERNRRSRS